MQRLEVSGAVRPLKGSLGVKGFCHLTVGVNAITSSQRSVLVLCPALLIWGRDGRVKILL